MAYMWVLVTVAIIAALAAAAAPSLSSMNDTARVTSAVATLRQVGQGIINFRTVVHSSNNTLNFPGKISQLTNKLKLTDRNSCGALMVARDTSDWVANAPFLPFMAPTIGIATPIGVLNDSIPRRASTADSMFIEMSGVTMADAERFKAAIDSNSTPVGDTVTIKHAAVAGKPDTTTLRMRLFRANAFPSC
jgi:type II secretory pathway pseudopilin PulG